MKIEYALLADAAQAVGGKVFVLGGGWNLFRAASYPAPVQFAIAIGLGFASSEIGMKYVLNVAIADESGVPIVPEMKGQVETGQPAPDVPKTASIKIPVAININMSLPHPGTYGIVVTAGRRVPNYRLKRSSRARRCSSSRRARRRNAATDQMNVDFELMGWSGDRP